MTKSCEQEDKVRTHAGARDAIPRLRAMGQGRERQLLLAISLSLWGCSLAAPKEGDLFSPSSAADGDAGQMDSSSAFADSGEPPHFDSGQAADTGSEIVNTADGGVDTDAGSDAALTPFDPQAGLIIHYSFNETTGDAVHDLAGSKDALIFGAPDNFQQWVSPGRVDGALKLSGETPTDGGVGHYVELPQSIFLGLDECSIALWLNRTGGPNWQRVFDLGSGTPDWIYFTAVGGNGLPAVAGRTPGLIFADYMPLVDATVVGEGQLKIMQPIPVSTWVHFTLTWNTSLMTVYLNGKIVAQTTTHAQVKPSDLGNTINNYLGRSQYPADPYFNGMLDEFRMYNRALSPSDVAQLAELQ